MSVLGPPNIQRPDRSLTLALTAFFTVIQFYTSLAALSPTPPVGYLFATPPLAGVLVATLVGATILALVRLARERKGLETPSRAILAAWLGSATLSSILGFDPSSSLAIVGMMAMGAVFHLALVRFYARPGLSGALLGTYLAVGTLASIAAMVMELLRRPALLWALNHGRAAGFFVTANQFAAFLIAFVFVALGVALARRGALRSLAWTSVVVGTIALGSTFSLAGWIGAVAGAVFFAYTNRARRTAAGLILVATLLGFTISARPATRHNPAEAFDRIRVWQAGIRVAELFPLTGVGPVAYWRVYPAIRPANADMPGTFGALHPHDAYLSLAGETGIVGLAAFAYGWWRFVGAMRARLRARPPAERRLPLAVCAALVAVLVQGIFDTIGVVQMAFVWIPYMALALASAGAPRREPA